MVKPYYTGMCETCHAIYENMSRWQVIKMWFRHKHLLHAVISSDASFLKQEGYEEIKTVEEEEVK